MIEDNFATTVRVKEFGNMPKLKDEKITPYFNPAKLEVIDIIGEDVYEEIFAAGETEHNSELPEGTEEDEPVETSYTQLDYNNLVDAESYMVLKLCVPNLNASSQGDGFTKATGTGDGRQENISEFDVDKKIERYEAQAMKILKRYIVKTDRDEDGNTDGLITPSVSFIAF